MKVAKLKDKKIEKNKQLEIPENEYSIKKIIVTLIVLVAIFFLFYFITMLVIKPTKKVKENNNIPVEIDSTLITMNHLLDRKDSEYYVLASKSDSKVNYNEIYNRYLSTYKAKEEALKVYKVDLSDSFNNNYIGETNITDNLSELKVNEDVLFKIKDGKIEQHFIGSTDISKALKEL